MRYELQEGKNILIVDESGVHFTNKKSLKVGEVRTVAYDQIASVDLVPALLSGGCLYFKSIKDTSSKPKGILALQHEENAFFFGGHNTENIKKIKSFVDDKVAEIKAVVVSAPGQSDADELLKFKQLLDAGAITQDEYDKKKAQILGL